MTLDAWTQTHIYWHSQRIRKSKCADTDPSADLHLILYRPRNADVTTQTSERTRASFTSRNTFPSSLHTVMPIGPDGRRRESTHKEPICVIQLKSVGYSFRKMQQKTRLGKTAIHRIVDDWNTIINVWSM